MQKQKSPLVRRYAGHFAGQNGLMVGGTPCGKSLDRIWRWFQFASLDWPEIKPQADLTVVGGLANRIVGGRYAIVIFLHRWASHSIQNLLHPACESASVLWLPAHNHSVTSVCRGLDRLGIAAGGAA